MKLSDLGPYWEENGMFIALLVVAWPLVLILYVWQLLGLILNPMAQAVVEDAKRKHIARNRIEEQRTIEPYSP